MSEQPSMLPSMLHREDIFVKKLAYILSLLEVVAIWSVSELQFTFHKDSDHHLLPC